MIRLGLLALLLLSACSPSGQVIQSAIAQTQAAHPAGENTAATASLPSTEMATITSTPLRQLESISTPFETSAPALPVSYVYEGQTQGCACDNCYCVTNIVIVVRLTINEQGHISGSVDKYLADVPAISFEGTKENLYGVMQFGRNQIPGVEKEKDEFTGTLSHNLHTLQGMIASEGTYIVDKSRYSGQHFSARRTFILFRR